MAPVREVLWEILRGLRALGRDHRSGAAEIAARAALLLEDSCRREHSEAELAEAFRALAGTLLRVQPSMAPLLNLANRVQLAAEAETHRRARLRRTLREFRRQQRQAAGRIAPRLARLVPQGATLITYSYSSTVFAALRRAKRRIARVVLSEGRPMREGRALAAKLADAGIRVTLLADAALPGAVSGADAVVVGADAVLARGYVNKVGTAMLQRAARAAHRPVYVLADSTKFLPPALAAFHRLEDRPPAELWRRPPRRVEVTNRCFEFIPFAPHVRVLSERGLLTAAQVRRQLKSMPVARRLAHVAAKEPR